MTPPTLPGRLVRSHAGDTVPALGIGAAGGPLWASSYYNVAQPADGALDSNAIDDIEVDENCILLYEPEYRKRAKDSCTPEEIVAGVIAQENTHVAQCIHCNQCKGDCAHCNNSNPAVWGVNEVAAHLVGIAKMLESLKRLCPNYDTTSYEIRMETINRSRLKP